MSIMEREVQKDGVGRLFVKAAATGSEQAKGKLLVRLMPGLIEA